MSLRRKLLALFVALGLVPLIAIGLVDYVRSAYAIDALVAHQMGPLAQRAATVLADRSALYEADLAFLAENAATREIFGVEGPVQHRAVDATDPFRFLQSAWSSFRQKYVWISFTDTMGAERYRLGSRPPSTPPTSVAAEGFLLTGAGRGPILLHRDIVDEVTQQPVGRVTAAVPADVFPFDEIDVRFGTRGRTMIIDGSDHSSLYRTPVAIESDIGPILHALEGLREKPDDEPSDDARIVGSGTLTYEGPDGPRVAAFAALGTPPWTVVASTSTAEFADTILRMRIENLVLVLLAAAIALTAYLVVLRRATRSLERLAQSADEMGKGRFVPIGLPAGHDEVGRLSMAFDAMATNITGMMEQLRRSRELAAIGEFASRLSHEIRTPLTSLKLNLQTVNRDVRSGRIPPQTVPALDICLGEIDRLDRVAGGVLALGRVAPQTDARGRAGDAVRHAMEILRPQLDRQHIVIDLHDRSNGHVVAVGDEAIRSVMLNLLTNAAEAMPAGGMIDVAIAETGSQADRMLSIEVADQGPGVPLDARERIFEPFYTTKPRGTGLGLALAAKEVEQRGGRIRVQARSDGGRGAAFVIELPLIEQLGGEP